MFRQYEEGTLDEEGEGEDEEGDSQMSEREWGGRGRGEGGKVILLEHKGHFAFDLVCSAITVPHVFK